MAVAAIRRKAGHQSELSNLLESWNYFRSLPLAERAPAESMYFCPSPYFDIYPNPAVGGSRAHKGARTKPPQKRYRTAEGWMVHEAMLSNK